MWCAGDFDRECCHGRSTPRISFIPQFRLPLKVRGRGVSRRLVRETSSAVTPQNISVWRDLHVSVALGSPGQYFWVCRPEWWFLFSRRGTRACALIIEASHSSASMIKSTPGCCKGIQPTVKSQIQEEHIHMPVLFRSWNTVDNLAKDE